jgi:hypothetical protein
MVSHSWSPTTVTDQWVRVRRADVVVEAVLGRRGQLERVGGDGEPPGATLVGTPNDHSVGGGREDDVADLGMFSGRGSGLDAQPFPSGGQLSTATLRIVARSGWS